jgi:leucine dehydrogenase
VELFEAMTTDGHEEVLFGVDKISGLKTIIAIHSTALGPALGGTRFYPYDSEEAALRDVLRLSRGMTFKSASAGLDLGGGKAVIMGDPRKLKSERVLRAYGKWVDSLAGRYITAEDVGTELEDMSVIRRETRWVVGLPLEEKGSGDPSPFTARGVLAAMRATAQELWGSDDLAGKTVAIQGVGKVGISLVEQLVEVGAKVIAADLRSDAVAEAVKDYGATAVEHDDVLKTACDILAPCALGGILNPDTIPGLKCAAVVGSANNQLLKGADAQLMADRDILYCPDFVANAGGVINVAEELHGYSKERALRAVDAIYANTKSVFTSARTDGVNPHIAAKSAAERRIHEIGTLRLTRRGGIDVH